MKRSRAMIDAEEALRQIDQKWNKHTPATGLDYVLFVLKEAHAMGKAEGLEEAAVGKVCIPVEMAKEWLDSFRSLAGANIHIYPNHPYNPIKVLDEAIRALKDNADNS
jgi:hypothetical protein